MVCEVATTGMIEEEATAEACNLIRQYFPSVKFQPDCETAVTAVWDQVKALCPRGNETTAGWPSPQEIEKMLCKVAKSDDIEKEATKDICKLVKKEWPEVSEIVCESVVEASWDRIKALCPKGNETNTMWPSPEEIEKMVCEVATTGMIEEE